MDSYCSFSAFSNTPHHKGLTSAAIASSKNLLIGSSECTWLSTPGGFVIALFYLDTKLLSKRWFRTQKAERKQHQVSLQHSPAAGNFRHLHSPTFVAPSKINNV